MSLAVFLVCIGCALSSGLIEGLLLPLRKKLSLPFTVLTDIGLGALLVAPLGAAVFLLYDGRLSFYAVAFAAAGFAAGARIGRLLIGLHKPKPKTEKTPKKIAKTA
ncbi:MAG: hypothetical protein K2M95_03075 [Clostridiales bacterium]|nr:hypothetical protein [Clostridiales bacterium]